MIRNITIYDSKCQIYDLKTGSQFRKPDILIELPGFCPETLDLPTELPGH